MLTLVLDPLDKNFVLAKPIKQDNYDEKIIYDLEKKKQLLITRKRNGWKLFAVKAKGKIKIYTDGMNDITDRLERLVEEIKTVPIPDNSLWVNEGVLDERGSDHYELVGSILNPKVKTEMAIERQKKLGFIKMMNFDVVIWDGIDLLTKGINLPYFARVENFNNTLPKMAMNPRYLLPVQILIMSYDRAKKEVVKKGWEGLVLYWSQFRASYRLDGKSPKRHHGCWKWKPIHEDDFIVRSWIGDDDKHPRKVKEVLLSQIDPKTGKEFDCGKIGGFTNKTRKDLITARYPLVMQIRFDNRFASGKLQSARYMHIRRDKKIRECVAPKSFNNPT